MLVDSSQVLLSDVMMLQRREAKEVIPKRIKSMCSMWHSIYWVRTPIRLSIWIASWFISIEACR